MISLDLIKIKMLELDINQTDLANKLGVKPQNVSAWFTRGSISKGYIVPVMNLLGIDIKDTISNPPAKEIEEELLHISTITAEAGASANMNIENIDVMDGGIDIVIRKDGLEYTSASNLVGIPVSGISMLPTIMPNEMAIVDKGISRYAGDDLYVLNYAGNMLIKRLQYIPSENSIEVISDNPAYRNYKVNLSDDQSHFHIIGRVVTTIRR